MTFGESDVRRSNGAGTGRTDETASESEYLPTANGTRYRRYILVKYILMRYLCVIHNHLLSAKSSVTVPMYRIPC